MNRQLLYAALFCCLCTVSALAQTSKRSDLVRLCNRVAEIKELPMKGDRGIDAAYDAIVAAGETIVPCLIDITKLDFIELLPEKIQTKYKNEGAYAYHDYMARKGARRQLQLKVQKWWRQKQT